MKNSDDETKHALCLCVKAKLQFLEDSLNNQNLLNLELQKAELLILCLWVVCWFLFEYL